VPVRQLKAEAEEIPLDIIYEDEYLAIINKPPGMVVHPSPGNWTGTLVNALMHRYNTVPLFSPESLEATSPSILDSSEVEDLEDKDSLLEVNESLGSTPALRPGIVHRLDKDTSGAIVVAKTAQVQPRWLLLKSR